MAFQFNQNKVWHSYFKTASPLVIRFTSEVRESDYTPGQEFVYFEMRNNPVPEGEKGGNLYLVIENDTVKSRIESTPLRQWVQVTAIGGGREDDAPPADLIIEAVKGMDYEAPRPVTSAAATTRQRFGAVDIESNYQMAFEAALRVIHNADYPRGWKGKMTDDPASLMEHARQIATTMFIQWSNTGFSVPLTEDMAGAIEIESAPGNEDLPSDPPGPVNDEGVAEDEEFDDEDLPF